jgi:ribosomal protein L37E
MSYEDHDPIGNPCTRCGRADYRHRVSHTPVGNPCAICGLPRFGNHRNLAYQRRKRSRDSIRPRVSGPSTRSGPSMSSGPNDSRPYTYVGVDGEGHGRHKHRYMLLGANTEHGEGWYVENPDGLTTKECLDFLLTLPIPKQRKRVFSYSFNYDLTKILEDVDNRSLYMLFRPELRQRHGKAAKMGPRPVKWPSEAKPKDAYSLNLQGTKFTVSKDGHTCTVWDLYKFYQSRFVQALTDWKVGSPTLWQRMQDMKDNRAKFDELLKIGKLTTSDIRRYMLEECACMAELGRKLIEAHEQAGLELKSFYGAGSSGAAILNKLGIMQQRKSPPDEMKRAVASAFFGGRFENSRIGTVQKEKIWNYDISSAYPYQLAFLPCLLHAHWERTADEKQVDARSLVRYHLEQTDRRIRHWGPFPFRSQDGSICFPVRSSGGWIWGQEFLEGRNLFPGSVHFREAWVYKGDCACRPFEQIPHYYRERCRLGKEGPGIVLKLGPSSCYGKLAQSVGNAPFQSWVWAGMITSGCRAQALELMGLHHDLSNILMIATDGLMSLEDIAPPIPKDTDTFHLPKPLGGWEKDVITKGIFLARPGIYFPLNPQPEELKKVRARGVGKASVLEQWQKIVRAWEARPLTDTTVKLANISRFCGAKTSITRSGKPSSYVYTRSSGKKTSMSYGQWITREVQMSFDPMPKRECVLKGGFLKVRSMPRDLESVAYDRASISQESLELKALRQELDEQPDKDMLDYEV